MCRTVRWFHHNCFYLPTEGAENEKEPMEFITEIEDTTRTKYLTSDPEFKEQLVEDIKINTLYLKSRTPPPPYLRGVRKSQTIRPDGKTTVWNERRNATSNESKCNMVLSLLARGRFMSFTLLLLSSVF
jgi:hypothetical protein